MTATANTIPDYRWVRTLRSADTLADDLGSLGAWVGPRAGPSKRTHGDKEDYVLRRLLVAWKEVGQLRFPLDVRAQRDQQGAPDFLLSSSNGTTLGVEVTEAGAQDYQAWLTRTARRPARGAGAFKEDGYVGDEPERKAACDILNAIKRKVANYDSGKYRTADGCDLLVYDNSETGWMADEQQVLNLIGQPDRLLGRFRQIHLVSGAIVFLDLFGADPPRVDVRPTYEIDYTGWISDQVERLRLGKKDELDLIHIAEELEDLAKKDRRALASKLRNLLHHLLKWQYQPKRRGTSWQKSIITARTEIEELLSDSPSLGGYLRDELEKQYFQAQKLAALDIRMDLKSFPKHCPYAIEQLLDPEYLPDAND